MITKEDRLYFKEKAKERARRNKAKKKKKVKNRSKAFPNTWHLKSESYIVFLASNYWKIVREMVLKRDGYKCMICSNTKYLQVHHDHYKNHFNEHNHLEDLMTLCRGCHKEHHYAQE